MVLRHPVFHISSIGMALTTMPSFTPTAVTAPPPLSGDRLSAVCFMTAANALHMAAYEFGRSATMTLFTSDSTGFAKPSAVTIATGLVSPISIGLLYIHRRVFDAVGPRKSVSATTLAYASIILGATLLLQSAPPRQIRQATVLSLFVLSNSFVHLLVTQHWSFLTSVLQSNTAPWTPVLAGMGSITSTLAGWAVTPAMQLLSSSTSPVNSARSNLGLNGLLMIASAGILCTTFLSDTAYAIAEKKQFLPSPDKQKPRDVGTMKSNEPLVERARALFQRVPILGALCSEVLICQSISSLLSFLFVVTTKQAIPNDSDRAKHTGNIYARINLGTAILQFAILPFLLKQLAHVRHWMWLIMPSVVLVPAIFMALSSTGSFELITGAFCAMKILEYSLRGALTETVYGSLDFESRYFGKEIISLVANRFGKSTTAVALAVLSSSLPAFSSFAPSILIFGDALWFVLSYRLGNLLRLKSKTV